MLPSPYSPLPAPHSLLPTPCPLLPALYLLLHAPFSLLPTPCSLLPALPSSVLGNLSLALVTATMSFRIYKSVLAAVNKTQEGHPFKVPLSLSFTSSSSSSSDIPRPSAGLPAVWVSLPTMYCHRAATHNILHFLKMDVIRGG